ncbi:MAG: hypothetical protein MRY63_03675 [Neomegalonema sp.]|nr:hypothetical protein [Neomegalonema sp.]
MSNIVDLLQGLAGQAEARAESRARNLARVTIAYGAGCVCLLGALAFASVGLFFRLSDTVGEEMAAIILSLIWAGLGLLAVIIAMMMRGRREPHVLELPEAQALMRAVGQDLKSINPTLGAAMVAAAGFYASTRR